MISFDEQYKKIKYIFIDLDGTLLNSERMISDTTIATIKKAMDAGIEITLTSGRIGTMIGVYQDILNLNGYVISSNGAHIEHVGKKKTVFKKYVEYNDALNLMNYCLLHEIECNILTTNACYFSKSSLRINRFIGYNTIASKFGSKPLNIKIYFKPINQLSRVEKLLIQSDNDQAVNEMLKYISLNTNIQVTSSDHQIYDCSAKNISKGNAVEWIMNKHHINQEEVLVFGDYDNDVSMFKKAGIAVAMKNGSDLAMKNADFVTDTNDNDGVAKIINEVLKAKGIE